MQPIILKLSFPLSCLLFLSVIIVSNGENAEYKHRTKRRVVFSKSSKFFFRLNGKDNVLNHTEIFAHGWSIRMNYDLPETIPKRHQFFKRDVHAELENITDESVLTMYSCILKYLCENIFNFKASNNCGIFCGINNIITKSTSLESEFFISLLNQCDHYINNCPYLFKDAYVSNFG